MNVTNFFKFIGDKRPKYSLKNIERQWKVDGLLYPYSGNGAIVNGIKEGQFEKYTYYYPENIPSSDAREFALRTGENIYLSSVTNYKNGEYDGQYTSYHPNGEVHEISNFKNGNRYGVSKRYYLSGKLMEETQYDNGMKNGYERHYTKNGKLQSTGDWVLDKRVGQHKTWTEDGNVLIKVTTYVDGKLNGPHLEFYSNGKLQVKGTFVDGQYVGEYEKFHSNGKIQIYVDYSSPGKKRYSAQYGVNGNKMDEVISTDTHSIIKVYHKNGQLFYDKYIDRKTGKLDGECKRYDENGRLFEKIVYDQNHLISHETYLK